MSFAGIKHEIRIALLRIDERLLAVEGRLVGGIPHDKAEAAAELEFLKRQRLDLEHRLAELDRLPKGPWATIRECLKQEAALLERRLDEWAVHH
jgi:hypothetical protein